VFAEDGTVHVPAFDLPPSGLMSQQALEAQKRRAKAPGGAPPPGLPIEQVRKGLAAMLAPQVQAMLAAYPVDVSEEVIAGVPTRVFTPKDKAWDKQHVLINLHGGGFSMCWESCSMLESIPMAATGGYKVISVNYRMGPEAKHPAALEDATLVYRELLKSYKPQQIGVYGCSAGGALTAQLAAWLPAHGLPEPGAAGIFGAGAVRFGSGDSAYVTAFTDGSFGPPPKAGETGPDMSRGYFADVDMKDAIVSPALHPEVIAKFPPTLLITGTRAMDMSPAIVTNSALLKAGVDSRLVVGEGMGHCYIYQSNLPEARDAWQVIDRFFDKNLSQ
jgi:acetyl esterase/lipase